MIWSLPSRKSASGSIFLKIPALLFLLMAVSKARSAEYYLTPGNVDTLKHYLNTKSNATLVMQGAYTINELILISAKTNLNVRGEGAVISAGDNFIFRVSGSKNISIRDLEVNQTGSTDANVFDFYADTASGLENINYKGAAEYKTFAFFSYSAHRCYVKKSSISNVNTGIIIGQGSGSRIDPAGFPTTECLIEGNTISNFYMAGIMTRVRNDAHLSLDAIDTHARHAIKRNTVYAKGSHAIGIEAWGSENLIEGNTVLCDNSSFGWMGISLARSNKIICIKNRVKGPFTYQGIELASVHNSIISENIVENVSNDHFRCGGIGVNSNDNEGYDESRENLISGNQILNCKVGIWLGAPSEAERTSIIGNLIKGSSSFAMIDKGGQFSCKSNKFISNHGGIYSANNGDTSNVPNQIIGNEFVSTTSVVFSAENSEGWGRPFVFENNLVYGWGNSTYPEALVMTCGPSRVANNIFKHDGRSQSGFPIPIVVATKRISYGGVRHVFFGNTHANVPLTISAITSDRAAINSRNLSGWYNNYDLISNESNRVEIMPMSGSPITQYWTAGTFFKVPVPAAGTYSGYICTVSGTPGTWKGMGLVEP